MTRRIAPSILAADFGRLREQVREVVDAGAEVIHVDVMDGHFVAPLSMGPQVVSALRDFDVLLDVHLMVERPERHVGEFARAGANNITVHVEATPHVHYAIQAIREAGCTAGVALTPSTPVQALAEVRGDVWVALCMTVNPGWGGQRFIPSAVDKIARLRGLIGPDVELEVDGGIDVATAGPAAAAGATLFVAGTSVFGADDPGEAFRQVSAAAGVGSRIRERAELHDNLE
jgi:ribulose-phosphate 3-epimerase